MIKLEKTETELRGTLKLNGTIVELDEIGKRIERLVIGYLDEIANDKSGWYKLYQDPYDKRYWELSYPDSEMQGGGAPLLVNISAENAKDRYNLKQ